MTFLKITSTAICAFIGMFGAPVTVMVLMILTVIAMFFSDIWDAVKPAIQSMSRRRRFQSRQMNRVSWPKQEPDLPPIEYKEVKWY